MRAAGFSLIEVLVATAVVTVGVASLAQLFAASARANRLANDTTMTLLLAQQKMEDLRADADGSSPSPPAALSANTPGHFEYVDRFGMSLGGDSSLPPAGALYLRRWAIEPLEGLEGMSGSAGDALVLKVLVLQLTGGGHAPWGPGGPGGPGGDEGSSVTRAPGEARLVSVKTRKAS